MAKQRSVRFPGVTSSFPNGQTVNWSGTSYSNYASGNWYDNFGNSGTWQGTRCGPSGGSSDRDGDGLLDCWETDGIDINGDGTVDLALGSPPYNAGRDRKDIFVEADYMDCSQGGCAAGDTHSHQPDAAALQAVVNSFAAAPVSNPDGSTGITLHIMPDEPLPEVTPLGWGAGGPGFDQLKNGTSDNPCAAGTGAHLATASIRSSANCSNIIAAARNVFHYSIFGHDHILGSSGYGEIGGDDFMVTIGGLTPPKLQLWGGKAEAEAGTFMHELGHNLNLRHGGNSDNNCKPNYLSVMNYALQGKYADPTRPLDYSREVRSPLYEGSLDENTGVGGPAGRSIVWGVPDPNDPPNGIDDNGNGLIDRLPAVGPATGPVNWNGNAVTGETGVPADINNIGGPPGTEYCGSSFGESLAGFDDWAN